MTLLANALACERNGRVVFFDLGFEVGDGHCAELRGPNGSGKSSLLRLIAGLLPPNHGTLSLSGHEAIPQACHFIAHQEAIKSVLTVSTLLTMKCLKRFKFNFHYLSFLTVSQINFLYI